MFLIDLLNSSCSPKPQYLEEIVLFRKSPLQMYLLYLMSTCNCCFEIVKLTESICFEFHPCENAYNYSSKTFTILNEYLQSLLWKCQINTFTMKKWELCNPDTGLQSTLAHSLLLWVFSYYFTNIFVRVSVIAAVCYFSVYKLTGWDSKSSAEHTKKKKYWNMFKVSNIKSIKSSSRLYF